MMLENHMVLESARTWRDPYEAEPAEPWPPLPPTRALEFREKRNLLMRIARAERDAGRAVRARAAVRFARFYNQEALRP